MTGRPRRRGRRRLIARPFEEHESRAMRIAGNGETADAGNVFGAAMNGAARRLDAPSIDVDVVDCDIAHPSRPDACFARIFGDRHQPADHLRPRGEKRIRTIGHPRILRVPADHAAIKRFSSFGVGGHHVVPDKFSMSLGHGYPCPFPRPRGVTWLTNTLVST